MGVRVGAFVGVLVGLGVGDVVGTAVGLGVGDEVGVDVGLGVGLSVIAVQTLQSKCAIVGPRAQR